MSIIKVKKTRLNDERLKKMKNKILNSDYVKFSMNLPRHIHKRFRIKASIDGVDMKDILMPIILKYIENYK
jgi:hypothetical protein